MKVRFAYLGRSQLLESPSGGGQTLSMMPNLTRERVSFDAPLLQPLRFREAMSALHDVVINDLRFTIYNTSLDVRVIDKNQR